MNQVLEQIQVRLREAGKDCTSDSFQGKISRESLLSAIKSSGCCQQMLKPQEKCFSTSIQLSSCWSASVESHHFASRIPTLSYTQNSHFELHTTYFFQTGSATGFCYPRLNIKLWKCLKKKVSENSWYLKKIGWKTLKICSILKGNQGITSPKRLTRSLKQTRNKA